MQNTCSSPDWQNATINGGTPETTTSGTQAGLLIKPRDIVGEHLEAAQFHIQRGDLKACRDSLSAAAAGSPGNSKILATLGNVCFQLEDFPGARTQFQQVAQLEPQNVVVWLQLATVCQHIGDREGFVTALGQAIALDTTSKQAELLLAGAHFRAKNYGEAAGHYENLLAGDPANKDLLLPLAKCRFHLGNHAGSRELYEHVLQIDPANAVAVEAVAFLRSGKVPTALRSVSDIVRENPPLHLDHNGKPIYMEISPMIADFIEKRVQPGSRTIETGAGLSTLCFLAKGAHHTAIAPDAGLETRLREYSRAHGLPEGQLAYHARCSQDVVYGIQGEFDCVLIDGGHGFPIPFIDFFYLNPHLKKGGFLIIDDLEIWTGETLAKFLSCERSWKLVAQDGHRAIVFQKVGDARATEWTCQEFVVKSSLHPGYMETVIPRESLKPEGQPK